MSTLVAIAYKDPYRAEEVRIMLRKMHRDYLVDIDDAVVAVKDDVRTANPERVLEELKGTGGAILKSSLSHEDEARLQKALSAGKAA